GRRGSERGGVVLDAVGGIGRALRVVVDGRETLHLPEQAHPHVGSHPVPDPIGQPDAYQVLQIAQDRAAEQDAERECGHIFLRELRGIRGQDREILRKRLRPGDVVDNELDGQRSKDGKRNDGRGYHAEKAGQEREERKGSDNHGDGLRELAPSRHRPGRGTIASGPRCPPRGRPFCVGILLRVDERPELVEKLSITPIGRSAKLPSGWVDAAGELPRVLLVRRIRRPRHAATSSWSGRRDGRSNGPVPPKKPWGIEATRSYITRPRTVRASLA